MRLTSATRLAASGRRVGISNVDVSANSRKIHLHPSVTRSTTGTAAKDAIGFGKRSISSSTYARLAAVSGSGLLPGARVSSEILRGQRLAIRNFTATAAQFQAELKSAGVDSQDGPLFTSPRAVRNLAVIAHVDHGKTSLVDKLVTHCIGAGSDSMDSNPLERERGITILSKSTSVPWKDHTVNIVDTPGHADFGGEVERVLNMVDGVLLVVDAQEGPMPQTRYVLQKALSKGLKPIVVLNKCDREGARIGVVENEVFDLFVALEANDDQLDFPFVYASAREGWTVGDPAVAKDPAKRSAIGAGDGGGVGNGVGMSHLLDTIIASIPAPRILGGTDAPFRMLVSQMEMDTFMGKLVLGRISSGTVKIGDPIVALTRTGEKVEEGKVLKLFSKRGMAPIPLTQAEAGDIVQLAGLQKPIPTSTVSAPAIVRPLYADAIDPPTISMSFSVNDSPLGGKEGTYLTSSMIADRLAKEAAANIALEVVAGVSTPGMPDATEVRGRGELQLAVLIETMRREGFELSVSPPAVLFKRNEETNERLEPYEEVVVDIDSEYSGAVIEKMALRKGNLRDFGQMPGGKVRLNFLAPSRGLIGFQSDLKTDSRGTAVLNRRFEEYGPYELGLERKPRGVLVANGPGQLTAYALDMLQARGVLFVGPGESTYMGHIIGEASKDDKDMDVNPVRAKKLTNIRAAGKDDAITLSPPRIFSLEEAIVYVAPDELVEVTPSKIRLRKRVLDTEERSRVNRDFNKAMKAKEGR